MVERSTDPTPVPSLRNCTGRLVDGDRVKRTRAVRPESERLLHTPSRRDWLITIAILLIVALAVVYRTTR